MVHPLLQHRNDSQGLFTCHFVPETSWSWKKFCLADFDVFELVNFNRQSGVLMSTLNKPKCVTIAAMVRDINPKAEIEEFPTGVGQQCSQVLRGCFYLRDALDFFMMETRSMVFCKVYRLSVQRESTAKSISPNAEGVADPNPA